MAVRGIIFDIERFAIHDGPGIRTTLFMKGCPLTCWWCHNPEAISPRRELVFFESKCIGCDTCFETCPVEAHERLGGGGRVHHREKCTQCGRCVDACAAQALVMEGREIDVDEAVTELFQDRPFYATSGGGITLSGGEPMRQVEFTREVLRRCHDAGLHTALDTCGFARWDEFEKVLPFVDLVLYDLKHADPQEHSRYTGVSNDLIIENLMRIDGAGTSIEVRIPLVPGVNDSRENLEASSAILRKLGHLTRILVLPYHRLGEAKYARLGKTYSLSETMPPTRESMQAAVLIMASRGLPVTEG